jgi:crossover junction endodeoxyribonuclease RuvC
VILAIDPGLSGAFCLYDSKLDAVLSVADLPIVEDKKKRHLDLATISTLIDFHATKIERAVIEEPAAMPKQGVSSMFRFGFVCGALQGIVAANFIPVRLVSPAKWKRDMGLTADKDACRRRASQLWPTSSHLWSRVKDDGRAESALLALWAVKFGG